jgi:hypothetical protein
MLVNGGSPTEFLQRSVLFDGTRHPGQRSRERLVSYARRGGISETLNIHQSEALVRWIAEREEMDQEALGVKGRCGILRPMESRAAFWHDPTHQVVFDYTPKHASWMNQVEIWSSILVRKLLKCGDFTSLDDLRDQILASIAYYNRTMAKPIKWTYTGLPPDRGAI